MDDTLKCSDTFGREVVLPRQRWTEHILLDHGEMEPLLHLIGLALKQPDIVTDDANFHDRENFYLMSRVGTHANRHVKVCVEYHYDKSNDNFTGSIVTAFVTRNIKDSEVPRWRRDS